MLHTVDMSDTRLSAADYITEFDAEGEALIIASHDLSLSVPGCPEWTVADLLSHVLGVYRHKIEVLRTGERPSAPRESWGVVSADDDVHALLTDAHTQLHDLLVDVDPATPCWTFWPPDQTVGFWQRRMAHETSVHRWDAQSAVVGPDFAHPINQALAIDGIDELLGWLERPWPEQPEADGHTVSVSTEGMAWTLSLHPTEIVVDRHAADAQAWIEGAPSDLLLSLWGRPGDHQLSEGGDVRALAMLRDRLAVLG